MTYPMFWRKARFTAEVVRPSLTLQTGCAVLPASRAVKVPEA